MLRRAAEKVCRIFHLKDNGSRKNFACLLICSWMAAAVLVLTACRRVPAFEMDLLYVGQGDGVFITSHGRNFLFDGGSSTKEDLAKYTLIPFLHSKGRCRLDGIILTHDDGDHCSGILELLEAAAEGDPQIAVSVIYLPDIAEEAKGEHYRRIEELSAQVGIPVQYICRGMRIRSGNLTLDCLHPAMGASYEDANEYSTTLLLRYAKPQLSVGDFSSARNYVSAGNTALEQGDSAQGLSGSPNSFSALLTGDLEGQGEADLLQYLSESSLMNGRELQLKIDVLKVAHHGSKNATSEEFLQVVHPDMAMISAGINNMYKHPSEELLNRLAVTIPLSSVYRTDQQGEISILYNKKGGRYQVKTFLGDRAEALNH